MKHLIFESNGESTKLFFDLETSNESIVEWLKIRIIIDNEIESILNLNEGWSCSVDLDNNAWDVPTIGISGDEDFVQLLIVEVKPIKVDNNG